MSLLDQPYNGSSVANGSSANVSVVTGCNLSIANFKENFRKLGCRLTIVYELCHIDGELFRLVQSDNFENV